VVLIERIYVWKRRTCRGGGDRRRGVGATIGLVGDHSRRAEMLGCDGRSGAGDNGVGACDGSVGLGLEGS